MFYDFFLNFKILLKIYHNKIIDDHEKKLNNR